MSAHAHTHHGEHDSIWWLDQYWFVLLIAFGISCVLILALWHPGPPEESGRDNSSTGVKASQQPRLGPSAPEQK
ncbi:MAG TPA: hypothetical protein VM865_10330 [Acidobacteriaceae bacterium]|jgi:hypothetical protein|nr:hypothetical protein [Acidobacteriaceae bacterium]